MTKKKRSKLPGVDTAVGLNEVSGERLTDLNLIDALNTMKRRCFGLEAAVGYLVHGDVIQDGVSQIATDVANEMKSLADAFENERQMRIAERG